MGRATEMQDQMKAEKALKKQQVAEVKEEEAKI